MICACCGKNQAFITMSEIRLCNIELKETYVKDICNECRDKILKDYPFLQK